MLHRKMEHFFLGSLSYVFTECNRMLSAENLSGLASVRVIERVKVDFSEPMLNPARSFFV